MQFDIPAVTTIMASACVGGCLALLYIVVQLGVRCSALEHTVHKLKTEADSEKA